MAKPFAEKEKNFISVVAYIRNNEAYIKNFLTCIDRFLYDKFEHYEFVLVNDFSSDGTINKIREAAPQINGDITIINLAWNHNIELAMLSGVDISIGDFIIEFDRVIIDYPMEVIWDIYQKCLNGYEIVAASPNRPLKTSSRLFYGYLKKVSYRKLELTTETFRIISRRALNRISKSLDRIRYRKAVYHYCGFDTAVLLYYPDNNTKLKDSTSFIEKFDLAVDILIGFSNIGSRIAGSISAVFFIISIIAGVYTIKSYLSSKFIQPGWTTTMLFLSFSFTGIFLILSIISKYLVAILNQVQDSPKYVYKSIDKLQKYK